MYPRKSRLGACLAKMDSSEARNGRGVRPAKNVLFMSANPLHRDLRGRINLATLPVQNWAGISLATQAWQSAHQLRQHYARNIFVFSSQPLRRACNLDAHLANSPTASSRRETWETFTMATCARWGTCSMVSTQFGGFHFPLGSTVATISPMLNGSRIITKSAACAGTFLRRGFLRLSVGHYNIINFGHCFFRSPAEVTFRLPNADSIRRRTLSSTQGVPGRAGRILRSDSER